MDLFSGSNPLAIRSHQAASAIGRRERERQLWISINGEIVTVGFASNFRPFARICRFASGIERPSAAPSHL